MMNEDFRVYNSIILTKHNMNIIVSFSSKDKRIHVRLITVTERFKSKGKYAVQWRAHRSTFSKRLEYSAFNTLASCRVRMKRLIKESKKVTINKVKML